MVKHIFYACQITIGTVLAIFIAEFIGLSFTNSAGIITLLTILSSRWETLKLAGIRVLSFCVTVALAWLIFTNISKNLIAYGIFIFLLVLICSYFQWRNTLSVNAVIGNHFLATHNFGISAVLNELCLLMIGILVSLLIHLFHNNRNKKKYLVRDVGEIEIELQRILCQMAEELQQIKGNDVTKQVVALEKHMEKALTLAYEYRSNTWISHPRYYISYIKMRIKQCAILLTLSEEIRKIQHIPEMAIPISEFLYALSEQVNEWDEPYLLKQQLKQIRGFFQNWKIPQSHSELECHIVLYHILNELEDLLKYKQEFLDSEHKMW